jgi:hypothetical protein
VWVQTLSSQTFDLSDAIILQRLGDQATATTSDRTGDQSCPWSSTSQHELGNVPAQRKRCDDKADQRQNERSS